ncbi:MAG: DUF4337 domain-containing protein [Janthinobacterium lividum]
MSDEYEIAGPHEHALEHPGGHEGAESDPAAAWMAVMTAVLASVGAICSYQSGANENLALYYKNEAAIRKTEASNQWAYYQAKGEKQNLAELGAALMVANAEQEAKFQADIQKYRSQKEPIRVHAEAIEKLVDQDDKASEALMHQHHRWAQSTTLIQISIGLAAVALLTRRRWLRFLSVGVALGGVVTAVTAFMGG